MKRIGPEQQLGVSSCARIVALLFEDVRQPLEELDVAGAQTLPLRKDPLVVGPGQQLTAIEGHSPLERFSCSRVIVLVSTAGRQLELGNVE